MASDLIGTTGILPDVFDGFFNPWNDWFERDTSGERMLTLPAVNISEDADSFLVSLAAPGMRREDFKIDVQGIILTISAEKEQTKVRKDSLGEESERRFNRREYNLSSFSRSFTLPEDVKIESIEAKYENGILVLTLPKKEDVKKAAVKSIAVK